MALEKRYSFGKVMMVTAIACVFLIIFQAFALLLVPDVSGGLKKYLTWYTLFSHLAIFLFMSVFYYLTVNRFYTLFSQRRGFMDYVPVAVLALLAYSGYNVVSMTISKELAKRPELTTGLIIFSITVTSTLMTGIAVLIAYLTSLRDEAKQRKVLEKQKMELEVQNTQANFNFLKAQINPHFLHNTLNFFYAKALPLSAELSEGILCLSDIMRYALNEGSKDEKALLKDELEHLGNVIRINQLRFSNNLYVQFDVEGEVGGAMIVPFVLITIVENAFKHGDLKNWESPIIIKLRIEGKRLYFYCRNRKKSGFKEISTGIGLQNILRRLDIVYGKNYLYKVHDEAEFYTTELTIDPL
ncbi:MAG TPA: histidine kinase [Sediminibacterium sp.]